MESSGREYQDKALALRPITRQTPLLPAARICLPTVSCMILRLFGDWVGRLLK